MHMSVTTICVGVFCIHPKTIAVEVVGLIIANSRVNSKRSGVLLDFVPAVGYTCVLEAILLCSWAATWGCMNVAMAWKDSAKAPVTATSFERTGIKVSQGYRCVSRKLCARNQRTTSCPCLAWWHWGKSVTDAHVVSNKHVLACSPCPRLAFVPLLYLDNSDAILHH